MSNPIHLYGTAKGYVQSAFSMMSNPARSILPDDSTFYLSFHMLAGFATELYFKAYLSANGATEAELRSAGLRHNLKELHTRSKAAGLVDAGAAFLESALAAKHASFEFRYMKPGGQYAAYDLRLMFNAFSTLDAAVDQAVGGSASVGLAVRPAPWVFPDHMAAWRL